MELITEARFLFDIQMVLAWRENSWLAILKDVCLHGDDIGGLVRAAPAHVTDNYPS